MLKINNLSKSYGSQLIFQDINLDIEINTIIGLAGPSGSGKSTLLRCLQKLEQPTQGEIICHEKTGFMFQDFQLFPHMTILQNLTYAPKLHQIADSEHQARELLTHLNMADKAHHYPSQLSGGQKQRAALARLLMIKPTLLLCDEPTSGLDVSSISDVVTLLKKIQKEMNITMIIASHDLDFLSQIANRIVLLKNGKIVLDTKVGKDSDGLKMLHNYY